MKIEHVRYLADSEVSIRMECKKISGAKIKRKTYSLCFVQHEKAHFNCRTVIVLIENSQNLKLGKITDRGAENIRLCEHFLICY
jgi:hypothetical protein